MLLLDAGDELDVRILEMPGMAGCSAYSDALDALDQGIIRHRDALDALHSGYFRCWGCSASQDIPDARAALYPGYPGCWECSGFQDAPDAGDALAPRGSALTPSWTGLPAELCPRGPRAPPCPALPLLQPEPPGAAEQLQARTGMLPAKPAREEEDPECGKGSLPRQRGVQPAGSCESGCVQVPARLSPAALDARQGMQKCRSRRWGWGGEEEMK